MAINWDDPSRKVGEDRPVSTATFTLAMGRGFFDFGARADNDRIRGRQEELLSSMRGLRDRAFNALVDRPIPAETPEDIAGCVIGIGVLFRKPDDPQNVGAFMTHVTDHPVIIPTKDVRHVPTIVRDFVTTGEASTRTEIVAAQHRIDRLGGALGRLGQTKVAVIKARQETRPWKYDDLPEQLLIVFPKVVDFLVGWMEKLEGPIHRVQIWPDNPETTQRAIERSMTVLARRSDTPLAGFGLGGGQ